MSSAIQKADPFLPANMTEAERLATRLASSGLLPEALRGKPGDVLVTIITGHELGLSPMQAIRGMHVVKGKAIMSADLAVGLVKRHPECKWFRLVKSTDEIATYATLREGDPSATEMSFTIAQARNAKLGGDNWQKYPAAMLRARCSLALARAVYPDMMLGVYDPDEVPEARVPVERTVAPPPPRNPNLKVLTREAIEGEIVVPVSDDGPAPPSDGDAPPTAEELAAAFNVADAPNSTQVEAFDPLQEALALIQGAKTAQAMSELTEQIIALGVSKDPAFRKAYGERLAAIKKGAA